MALNLIGHKSLSKPFTRVSELTEDNDVPETSKPLLFTCGLSYLHKSGILQVYKHRTGRTIIPSQEDYPHTVLTCPNHDSGTLS